jgi:hypothetical protein
MNITKRLSLLALAFSVSALAADPSLTIYNQNFAVVRDTIPLDLKKGVNEVKFDGATLQLEPDSVILRDPAGNPLQILEQNYRNDPVTQQFLLSLFEGKEIDFVVHEQQKPDRIVKGKVIRSGYVPHGGAVQPIIEVDGKIQFKLPGEPVFPSLGDDTILKPQLDWKITVPKDLKTDAQLGYVTAGMSWSASYNLVAPEKGNTLDLVGWITMDNQSGRDFEQAQIKLMAGDVNKIQPPGGGAMAFAMSKMVMDAAAPAVTEKAFDDFHLYSLERATTLKDRETKQVEFIKAGGIKSEVIYRYDGVAIDWNSLGGNRILDEQFGTEGNTKVTVIREFKNSKENGLGIPLPKGRIRLYRSNGSQLEFTGENEIDHTPKDEKISIITGNAFDLVGERKRTNFQVDNANHWADESFEITLRNHKKEPVVIRVVEHLYRWTNWMISENSDPFVKTNAQQVEFRIQLKPDEEKKLSYKVRYSW